MLTAEQFEYGETTWREMKKDRREWMRFKYDCYRQRDDMLFVLKVVAGLLALQILLTLMSAQ